MSSASGSPKSAYPPFVLLAVAAAAALSLWGALDFYRSASGFASANPDRHGIEAAAERFREVAGVLPGGAVAGYLSDIPFHDVRGSTAFFGAQYALAPRILVPFPGRHRAGWVVGNFSQPVDYPTLAREHGLSIVKDLGRGLVVFRRAAD